MQRLLLYTDGACTNNAMASKQVCPTGWGVVVLLEKTEEVIAELFGQVELDPASKYYLGAEIGFPLFLFFFSLPFSSPDSLGTNNTAELTGVIEALLWIQDYLQHNPLKLCIQLLYDSEYAAKSILGIFNGKKNREMILRGRRAYQEALGIIQSRGGDLVFQFVKGHNGAPWNERADLLATTAAKTGKCCHIGRYASEATETSSSSFSPSSCSTSVPPTPALRSLIRSASAKLENSSPSPSISLAPPAAPPAAIAAVAPPPPPLVSDFKKIVTSITTTTTVTTISPSLLESTDISRKVTRHHELVNLASFSYQCHSPLLPYLANSKRACLSMNIADEEVIMFFEYDSRVIDLLTLLRIGRYSTLDKTWRFPMRFISELVEIWKRLGGVVDEEMEEMARRRGSLREREVPEELSLLLASPATEDCKSPPWLVVTILREDDLLTNTSQLIARLSASSPYESSSPSWVLPEKFRNLLSLLNIPPEYLNPLQQQGQEQHGEQGQGGKGPDWIDMTLKGFYDHLLNKSSRGYQLFSNLYRPTSCDHSDRILKLLTAHTTETPSANAKRMREDLSDPDSSKSARVRAREVMNSR